jgi:hypothetical protein
MTSDPGAGSTLGSETTLIGTPSQVEWAEQIRPRVAREFDRVAKLFRARMAIQTGEQQSETRTILEVLEQARAATMANRQAGYFIRDWQELNDQVRQLIARDPRYQVVRDQRKARRRATI